MKTLWYIIPDEEWEIRQMLIQITLTTQIHPRRGAFLLLPGGTRMATGSRCGSLRGSIAVEHATGQARLVPCAFRIDPVRVDGLLSYGSGVSDHLRRVKQPAVGDFVDEPERRQGRYPFLPTSIKCDKVRIVGTSYECIKICR